MIREEALKVLEGLEQEVGPAYDVENRQVLPILLSIVRRVLELHKDRPHQEITTDQVIGELCSCCPDKWPCRTFRIVSEELSKLGEGR